MTCRFFFHYVLSFYFLIVFTEVYKVVILTQLSGVSVGAVATSLDRAQQQVSSSPIHGCWLSMSLSGGSIDEWCNMQISRWNRSVKVLGYKPFPRNSVGGKL